LTSLGFAVARTRGSHATLVRTTATRARQILTVPLHKQLAPGTRHAIYRQTLKSVPADQLRPFFYRD
jgi:predicted RNA binding protein YcfA (HicA-like mRNA interferase family)